MYYMFFVGIILIIISVALLVNRIRFLQRAKYTIGTVVGTGGINYSLVSGQTKSKHLDVKYTDSNGYSNRFILKYSLLVYLYRNGDLIRLAIRGNRVFVATWINLLTAPGFFVCVGIALIARSAKAVF